MYDSTPSKITIGHVAPHLPCDSTGETELKVVAGVAPKVAPLELDQVKELSTPGKICIYHADLPQKNNTDITDIAFLNPTDTNITLPNIPTLLSIYPNLERGSQITVELVDSDYTKPK